jgi:dipeptidyl aminopeptidase/acylaminoacyl peptidase
MKKFFLLLALIPFAAFAKEPLSPEKMWELKRVSPEGISKDGKHVFFASKQVDWKNEKSATTHYVVNVNGEQRRQVTADGSKTVVQRTAKAWYALNNNNLYRSTDEGVHWESMFNGLNDADNVWVSPDEKYIAFSKEVMVKPVNGSDLYSDLPKTTAQVYTSLNYRHWDTWEDGKYSHIFVVPAAGGEMRDVMPGQAYDAPGKPFGGAEDLAWAPDSKGLIYVCKKKYGKDYATSTNTDLYYYDLRTRQSTNWTEGMMGYDNQPAFSSNGRYLAWLSMERDGFEADKVDIVVMDLQSKAHSRHKITKDWDESAGGFIWAASSNKLYFTAAMHGTEQLFEVNVPTDKIVAHVRQITNGQFDVNGIVGQCGKELVVTRCDMNHATELFAVTLSTGKMHEVTHENEVAYQEIKMSNVTMRTVTTTDGQDMGVWVIYPPDFDPAKKYPTLLYCQGGPQSALSQFYSFRWNFQLMAAQGYIVVAPNRRGMPGWGVKWNADISKDWGGQPMRDYLAAIDNMCQEPYVDKNRLGCIGASYGGYSVYMLAGMHNGRFKSFIAHDGLFDLKSWYGTTEELWFANWDIEGAYWVNPQPKSYELFNPSNFVAKWTAPIMIVQGGTDYRVPIEQGLEAYQAAQLRGLKSKLLYFPNENHWVLHAQNGLAWQREFFAWLKETL